MENKPLQRCFYILFISVLSMQLGGCLSVNAPSEMEISSLRCEYRLDPIGIDTESPRFSWKLTAADRGATQTAYRILVASNRENLLLDRADLWDSGRVRSNRTVHASYAGRTLQSRDRAYWKVCVWDGAGRRSAWSPAAYFEMGLLDRKEWQGIWLSDGKSDPVRDEDFYRDDPAPLFRKEFNLERTVRRARLYISGLGYYEAFLNGKRVGDHVLDPGWTAYSKRVLYSSYDITSQLKSGGNCLAVELGNGWFNPLPLRMWGRLNLREHLALGRPRFISQLIVDFEDGSSQTVQSDSTWRTHEGPLLRNNLYLGEVYDARRELPGWRLPGFDDDRWATASPCEAPSGELCAQQQPPIQITAELEPVSITEPNPGVFIFDLGQNFSGWAGLKVTASPGTEIRMRFAELLHADGSLNPMTSVAGQIKGRRKRPDGTLRNVGGLGSPEVAWQSDTYICRGQGEEVYIPRFAFHAFRYVEVSGYPRRPTLDSIKGYRLNSAIEPVGSFACSSEAFNRIQRLCQWTFLSNVFSVQSDCPHREKFGYGGDMVATSDAFMMNYDMATFYGKAVRDWEDSRIDGGRFTDTAPFVGIDYCGVGWAMIHPQLLLQLYQYYGNHRLIEEQYPRARRWLEEVGKKYPGHIVNEGLSDHEGLAPMPAEVMVTPLYARSARILQNLALILGKKKDAARFGRLADDITGSYADKFINRETGQVGPGTQGSQLFTLYLQMAPPSLRPLVSDYLLAEIEHRNNHLTTGILGTKLLLDVLSRLGYVDLAAEIVNQRDFPGWRHMIENGATTLWEHWAFSDNTFSHNHPMFGSVSQWFYNWLGGIQPHPEAVAFNRIIFKPQFLPSLDWVESSYNSQSGLIVSNWSRQGPRTVLEVTVPVNTTAEVHIPGSDPANVREGSGRATDMAGLIQWKHNDDLTVFTVGSGTYHFNFPRPDINPAEVE